MKEIIVVLNNIRSSENVGSIFRTCDASGVQKIILCGYTPAPLDRFGRENKKLTKSALGAEKFLSWQKNSSLNEALNLIRSSKTETKVVAVEQDSRAIDYKQINQTVSSEQILVLVFGNETEGLSKEDLDLCDVVVEIPMKGEKESLNVSVAVGVVLFSIN